MPNHRLFVWQRQDMLGTGRAEVMVKAAHLINGSTITRLEGGFFDGFQILLDRHEILYAEGIAVESLMVTGQTRPALPEAILAAAAPDLSPELRTALELDALALARAGGDPAKALYEASLGGKNALTHSIFSSPCRIIPLSKGRIAPYTAPHVRYIAFTPRQSPCPAA